MQKVIDARPVLQEKGRRGAVVKALEAIIREHELTYSEFVELSKVARDRMELKRPSGKAVVKPVPSLDDVRKFMRVIERQSSADALMMKMLLFMGMRSVELVQIRLSDIDLTPGAERIFLRRKAGLDKTFVLPAQVTSLLRMYMEGTGKQVYLFESGYHRAYSTRAIRKKIQAYRDEAGVGDIIHAHNFRHLLLTVLANDGWTDSELQLVSGHDSRGSLDRYIYKNPELIRKQLNVSIDKVLAEGVR